MVRLLNAPQAQPIVRQDPTMGALAQMAQTIFSRIGDVQDYRTLQAQKSTEQMQKLIPELVKAGATNEEAVAAATKMVGGLKKQEAMKPTTFDMPFFNGQITMPNLGNIAQNAWGMMRTPEYQAPTYEKEKFQSQKSMKERGINTGFLPSGLREFTSGLSVDETKAMAPIIDAFLKWAKEERKFGKGGWYWQFGGGAKGDPVLALAVKSVEKSISDGEIDPYEEGFDKDALILDRYNNLKAIQAGKQTTKKEKPVDESNPLGLSKPKSK